MTRNDSRTSDSRTSNNNANNSRRTNDPQIVLDAVIKDKDGAPAELIVFSIPFFFFQIVCIVPIPEEPGTKHTRVYVKFKIDRRGDSATQNVLDNIIRQPVIVRKNDDGQNDDQNDDQSDAG